MRKLSALAVQIRCRHPGEVLGSPYSGTVLVVAVPSLDPSIEGRIPMQTRLQCL